MDVEKLRHDFPFLHQTVDDKPLVYFDNACMSVRPQQVIDEITRYYTDLSACAGRSNHRYASRVNEAVLQARKTLQRFINAKHESEVLFTRNTTEGINLIAYTLRLKPGELVVTSDKEHNSNLVPWIKRKQLQGIQHGIIQSLEDNTFDMSSLIDALKHKPKLVAITMTSNLDGVTFPIKEIVKRSHEAGAKVLVDAAQAAPHQIIDVRDLDVDFLAFSGHKMLGPSGTGVLYSKLEHLEKMHGFLVGGDTVEYSTYDDYKHLPPPEKYEAGLQNYAGIMGLAKAAEYLMDIGMDSIHSHEIMLNEMITNGLSEMKRVKIIGPKDPKLRGGIVSFTIEGVEAHQVALMLDQSAGIMVRSGQHCVHSWFHAKNIKGSIRASVYLYNKKEEVVRFVDSLQTILDVLT